MANAPFKMKGSTFKYEREAQMRTSTPWSRIKKGMQRVKKTITAGSTHTKKIYDMFKTQTANGK